MRTPSGAGAEAHAGEALAAQAVHDETPQPAWKARRQIHGIAGSSPLTGTGNLSASMQTHLARLRATIFVRLPSSGGENCPRRLAHKRLGVKQPHQGLFQNGSTVLRRLLPTS